MNELDAEEGSLTQEGQDTRRFLAASRRGHGGTVVAALLLGCSGAVLAIRAAIGGGAGFRRESLATSSVVSLSAAVPDGSGGGFVGDGSGSGSGGLHALQPAVLKRLWAVERDLLDDRLCPAATPEIAALRQQHWPRANPPQAPRVAKIIYINLAWDEPRRRMMERQLAQLSAYVSQERLYALPWERLEAVDAEEIRDAPQFERWRRKGFSLATNPNVQGDWRTAACAYSHYSAIRQVEDRPDGGLTIIAEDDVAFDQRFLQVWDEMWQYVPDDWDVLRVGWFSDNQNCSQAINSKVDRAGWQNTHDGTCAYCGAQAYIVNPKSKERILERFEQARMTHADELLGAPTPLLEDPVRVPEIRAYVTWPMLARILFDREGNPVYKSDRLMGPKAAVPDPLHPPRAKGGESAEP